MDEEIYLSWIKKFICHGRRNLSAMDEKAGEKAIESTLREASIVMKQRQQMAGRMDRSGPPFAVLCPPKGGIRAAVCGAVPAAGRMHV